MRLFSLSALFAMASTSAYAGTAIDFFLDNPEIPNGNFNGPYTVGPYSVGPWTINPCASYSGCTAVPEMTATGGLAAVAVVAALATIAWERRRRQKLG